ncbi:lipoyl protein ligase domain-containing protein [Natrarchaeobaculum sulfurireducens]|uniref:lipoyl protein ligase domain-containing protein n=1 Tax=Natrarchaeobaculum sulfurireducens TaxID=2044521 RepID=UPI000E3D0102|nr:lipoate--protein ligase family protein [Natrarchaeobaculum sulfurireducens]
MRVFRGRAATIEADRAVSDRLLSVAGDGEPAVRVWQPHRQLAFGRRDCRLEGYDTAREIARERGFSPIERGVGGRAVAYDGETTLAFARADPVADFRRGTDERYEQATATLERALAELGLEPRRGEPPETFCPGTHSLSVATTDSSERKVVGIAQRVRQDAALTAGIVLVEADDEFVGTLEAVYDALGVGFDPETVGSVAGSGGPTDPDTVRATIEAELVSDATATVEPVPDRLESP